MSIEDTLDRIERKLNESKDDTRVSVRLVDEQGTEVSTMKTHLLPPPGATVIRKHGRSWERDTTSYVVISVQVTYAEADGWYEDGGAEFTLVVRETR